MVSKTTNVGATQKKGLFDDDDDLDNSNFLSKKPVPKAQP